MSEPKHQYKQETGRPTISTHGKHPTQAYVKWLEQQLKDCREFILTIVDNETWYESFEDCIPAAEQLLKGGKV